MNISSSQNIYTYHPARKYIHMCIYMYIYIYIFVVQLLSQIQLFAVPWTAACQASLSFIISQSLLKFMSIESMMPSNPISSSVAPFSSCLQSFPASVLSNELALRIRWSKYWRFSFSISPSNEYSGLISFRIDWLDLFAIHGTLKSILQHHSSKAFGVQPS